ncbi:MULTISPECIES: hypothetical protein [Priestia]|uniref:hypothetical protein n=1 Tax=Priestia TaxID=2800373 RepID=UPI0011BB0E72|nr:hypothetical protein [Priestia megaterium]MBU8853041.1 hypothetical protein [Bacillus sp. FJAT-26377]MEB4856699.1 hypothetical protein [Priestia megaterium]QDZ80732.1 hypothetical protein D0440_15205 [Priestia megaterium]
MYTAKQVKFGSHIVIGVLFGILAAMIIGTFYQNVSGVLPYGMISGLAVGFLADTYYTIKTKIKVI